MMEVAVNEGRVARMHRRVDLLGLTHEVVIARVIEPPRDEIADPPKGVATQSWSPELSRRRDRHADRLVLRQARSVVPRTRTLDQHRAPRSIMSQEPHRAVTAQERQGVRLVIGLVVFDGDDLEHGVIPREGHERETPPDDALRKGNAPLTRNFGGRRPQAVRHPRGDSPGRSVEPRALVPGHALARGPRSLARASTKRRSESRFSQGRRSSPEA